MQKKRRGEQNLAMDLETFNPNAKAAVEKIPFESKEQKGLHRICGKGVETG